MMWSLSCVLMSTPTIIVVTILTTHNIQIPSLVHCIQIQSFIHLQNARIQIPTKKLQQTHCITKTHKHNKT